MPLSTPKNAAKLQVIKIAVPAAGALLFWALYSYNPSPRMQPVPLGAPGVQVSLPCQATSKTSTADSAFGLQSQTDFLCEADDVHYVVGYTDLPAEVVEPLEQAQATQRLMKAYIDNMLARTKGQLLASSTYHPPARQLRDWRIRQTGQGRAAAILAATLWPQSANAPAHPCAARQAAPARPAHVHDERAAARSAVVQPRAVCQPRAKVLTSKQY